jgi:hypothetical protein
MIYDTIFIVRDWNIAILVCFSGEPIHRVFIIVFCYKNEYIRGDFSSIPDRLF